MSRIETLLTELKAYHPKLIDLSLGRVERLLAKLGHPQKRLPPVVHIAGTNGKGSVTAYLTAMLQAAGKRVHVYTSPHLVRFNERISIAGSTGRTAPISDAQLVDVLERVKAINDGDDITQFEITTAAAFLAFAETPADALILEVGLGGRLDATNVIAQPALCVITQISMDHRDKLGETIAEIAAEKAGILKRGVTAVISQQTDDAQRTIEQAARRIGARLLSCGQEYDISEQNGRLVVQLDDALLDMPKPALLGRHQIMNAGTAVAAAMQLNGLGLTERAIERGLLDVRWPARMQRLDGGPLPALLTQSELWLDGGHNPAAGVALAQTMADLEERSPKPLHLVVGMMGQKDVAGFLGPFRGLARHIITVPIPRAHEPPHPPTALAEQAVAIGLSAQTAESVEAALKCIERQFPGEKRVLICGSLYLAGHVLALQEGIAAQPN
jgi:dihydrofolate synthase/folylpolyglutamate synthase